MEDEEGDFMTFPISLVLTRNTQKMTFFFEFGVPSSAAFLKFSNMKLVSGVALFRERSLVGLD